MAALSSFGKRGTSILCRAVSQWNSIAPRYMSTDDSKGWWKKMVNVRNIDPGKTSHSQLLADKDVVYELQIHSVKPEYMEPYLNSFSKFTSLIQEKQTGAELVGSWTVEIGDQDEAIHLWRYPGGYPVLNNATEMYRTNQEFVDFRTSRNKMLRSRKNQILLAFSFWGDIKNREGNSIYELRSYVLKPGTMIEWGNNWKKQVEIMHRQHSARQQEDNKIDDKARGIQSRRENNEAICGFFSHIGELYHVHHFWAYDSLQSRKEVRENAWRRPGWDECVAYTVPLIRHTTSRILIPTPFSPMQ